MAPVDSPSRTADMVWTDRGAARRGAAPVDFDVAAAPAHRYRRGPAQGLVRDLVPAEGRPQAQTPRRRRGTRAHPASDRTGVLLPGSFLPDITEGSIARLTKHALLATLDSWTIFDYAGFNLASLHQRAGQRAAHAADPRSGRAASAAVGTLAGHYPGGDRGPGRARHRARARDRQPAAGERHPDRDRRFRRRLLLAVEPARIAVRRAQARPQLRAQLRDRRHQRRHLPDRDRSRPPLRQRRGRGGRSRARSTCRRSSPWAAISARAR